MSKLALVGGAPVFDKPLAAPWPPVDDETAKRLVDLYYSRKWTAFDETERVFAQAFADHHGAKHGIFTINGTVTLECGLAVHGIGPGDEVIVPALTWSATAMAARYVGAKPVFVDIQPDTLCIDPNKIEAAINERTKAIMPVHLYGSMADMDRIMEIARRHGLRVIEDCAHVHGGIWGGRRLGSIGDVGSFSFQHSKTMACADSGICITSDAEIADRLFRMKQIGYTLGENSKTVRTGPPQGLVCHNYRATAFQALILQQQLKDLDARLERYGKAARYLEERLSGSTKIRFQQRGRKAELQSYFGWVMIFDDPAYADIPLAVLQKAFAAEGLDLIKTWGPVYRFIMFNLPPEEYRIAGQCAVTERVSAHILWMLHAYLGLDMTDVEKIGDVIEKVMGRADELRTYAKHSASENLR